MPGPLSVGRHTKPNSKQYTPKNLARRINGFTEGSGTGFRKPGSQNRKK